MSKISRTVWILSLTSLFTDLASEMLYPVLPGYLRSLGYSLVWIGLLEGTAECIVGLSKGYFGKESDRRGQRLPFIQSGYAISALSKPLLAVSTQIGFLFTARVIDRLGKGIRTAARDALLSQNVSKADKGRIFGFHRAWDTAGAVGGPLLAMAFLSLNPGAHRSLFLLAFLPGLISVALLFLIKEKKTKKSPTTMNRFFSFLQYYKISPLPYRWLLGGLCLFALANSSNVFLLLKAGDILQNDSMVIMAYLLYNAVYMLSAYPMGIIADRIGLKSMLLAGLTLFSVTYIGLGVVYSPWTIFMLFTLYGLYAAATEGIAKAWITNLVPTDEHGTALGLFAATQSVGVLLASTMAGLIWQEVGHSTTFVLSALLAFLSMLWIKFLVNE